MTTAERNGALAAAAWSAAVASRAEPARYRRGKQYLRENAVASMEVLPHRIEGEVVGSRPEPYHPSIVLRKGAASSGPLSVPSASAFEFSCTCPDWDEPCKHAVALALAFAEAIRIAPELLARVVGKEPADDTRPDGTSHPRPIEPPRERHLHVVGSRSVRPPEPLAIDPAVETFLSIPTDAPDPVRPELAPPLVGSLAVGQVDLGELVADAVHWLSVLYRP